MVDVNSITTAVSAASPAQALTAIQVAINDLSQNLQTLDRSVQLNATPVSLSNGNNSLTLVTALGSVTVTLTQQLSAAEKQNLTQQLLNLIQAQRPLTLTLQQGSPPTQAVLLIPSAPATTPVTPAAPQAQTLPPLLTNGETLSAVVLPAAAPQLSQPAVPASSLTPGNFIPASIAPLAANEAAANPAPPALPPQTANAAEFAPPLQANFAPETQSLPIQTPTPLIGALPQPSPPLASLLQPGNEVTLQIAAILPPTQNASPPLAPNQIITTVMGAGANGNLILKAGDATLFVKTQTSIPAGTNLVVSLALAKEAPPLTLPPIQNANFPALPQALAALGQISPQALAQIMANHIPQPTDNLPGALMFLFSAFKQGNVRGWLGGAAEDSLLNAGKGDIVASLSRELGSAGQQVQDTIVGEWRAYPIPLYAQQQFQALTLYVHSDRDARRDQGGDAPNKIRFLIDMRLSKLGAMQMDGFVQPKKLDMILRSENPLPEGLHHELRAAYITAVGAVGYAGTLNFQVGRRHWMVMQQPSPPGIVT